MRETSRGHAAASPKRDPSPRSSVGAARRSLLVAALVGGVVAGTWVAHGLTPAPDLADASAPAADLADASAPALTDTFDASRDAEVHAIAVPRSENAPVSRSAARAPLASEQPGGTDAAPQLAPEPAPAPEPLADPSDRADLRAAAAQAQERLDAVRDVLLDPERAARLEAEIDSAQALLARWPDAPAAAAAAQRPLVLTEPDPAAAGTRASLLEVVPTASVAQRVADSLTVAAQELPVVETVDGVTRVNGVVVVNKTFPLPPDYNPGLDPELAAAFDAMAAHARQEGVELWIGSGFRSYVDQQVIYGGYERRLGTERADTFSARPGYSEHQSGLAIDLNDVFRGFAATPAAVWAAEHAHEYGFAVRYPAGKEEITGYTPEAWHLRYLGPELAADLHDSGLTLEEYLGVRSAY